MEKTDFKLEYNTVDSKGSIPAIIVAAGSSTRMNGISKQFVPICGIPAIVHTLFAFERADIISNIIIVTKNEFISEMRLLADKYCINKISDIVPGGATRQESVINGLCCIKNSKYALIHDGARPLVTEKIINSVAAELNKYDCVICSVPVKDTIKKIDENGEIVTTVERSNLVNVQTPQGVNVEKYKQILTSVDVAALTDDASAFEKAGYTVKTVSGDYKNIKLTTREDIAVAEYFLEKGELI